MACHTRSNSFPSRPHPIIQEVDEHLCRLSSSDSTSTSSSAISNTLSGLKDLNECVDRLLQLQQALALEKHQKCADDLLNGSLRLLDICNIAKDALLQTKECMHNLQSVIGRRRRGEESEVVSCEIKKYLNSRKMVKKEIQKAMNLKEKKTSSVKNDETIAIVSKLRDVEAVSLTIFELVLSFISDQRQTLAAGLWFQRWRSRKE